MTVSNGSRRRFLLENPMEVKPRRTISKVKAATAAAGAPVVLVWLLAQFGVDMPLEVAAGIVLVLSPLLTLAAGWAMPIAEDDFAVKVLPATPGEE